MVPNIDSSHTSFSEAEHNRAFFERLIRLQSTGGGIVRSNNMFVAPHHAAAAGGQQHQQPHFLLQQHLPTSTQGHHQTSSSAAPSAGGGDIDQVITNHLTSSIIGNSQQSKAAAAGLLIVAGAGGAAVQQQHQQNQNNLQQVQQQQRNIELIRFRQHEQQYMLAAMRNQDLHSRQQSPATMFFDVSTLRHLQQNAVFAPHDVTAAGIGSTVANQTYAAGAPAGTILLGTAPSTGVVGGMSTTTTPGTTPPVNAVGVGTTALDGNGNSNLLSSASSSLVFPSPLLAEQQALAPSASSAAGGKQENNNEKSRPTSPNTTRPGQQVATSKDTDLTSSTISSNIVGNKHARDEHKEAIQNKRLASTKNNTTTDETFENAMKQLKSGEVGLRAGEQLLSMILHSTRKESDDTLEDDCLAGKVAKGLIENDCSILDLLLTQDLKEKIHNDSEELITDYLKRSETHTNSHKNGDKSNTKDSDSAKKDKTFNVSVKDIEQMAKEITKQTEKNMSDAMRKAAMLSYVEAKNNFDIIIASQEHGLHIPNIPQNEDTPIRSDRASDANKSTSKSNQYMNDSAKIKAMLIEHEQFVSDLVDEHEQRESSLREEMEAQKVMHSRMVENCLLASSKALKVVRDKVAEDLC